MKDFKAKIVFKAPIDLIPYDKNTKIHTDEQIQKLAGAIAKFGFGQPIQVDKENVIITGHCRREAALALGMQQVPCIVRSDLTKTEVRALRISDNKLAESKWDEEALEFELRDLNDSEFQEFDLIGFTAEELEPYLDLGFEENEIEDAKEPKESKDKEVECPHCKKLFVL